eukprot:764130-Hanusia_phi.AAC.1
MGGSPPRGTNQIVGWGMRGTKIPRSFQDVVELGCSDLLKVQPPASPCPSFPSSPSPTDKNFYPLVGP